MAGNGILKSMRDETPLETGFNNSGLNRELSLNENKRIKVKCIYFWKLLPSVRKIFAIFSLEIIYIC